MSSFFAHWEDCVTVPRSFHFEISDWRTCDKVAKNEWVNKSPQSSEDIVHWFGWIKDTSRSALNPKFGRLELMIRRSKWLDTERIILKINSYTRWYYTDCNDVRQTMTQSGYYNTRIKANGENITSTTDQPFDTTPLSVNKVIHEREWTRIQVLGESAISTYL